MPSILIGNLSGGDLILSGCPWSGKAAKPLSTVQLVWDPNASGNCYVSLSGGLTVASGGFFLSGGGNMDGLPMQPGGTYAVPRAAMLQSGSINIYVTADAACSGQARMYYEIF